jgi:hypothetical protein
MAAIAGGTASSSVAVRGVEATAMRSEGMRGAYSRPCATLTVKVAHGASAKW